MAAYQALYRKWRPRRFADIVGQEPIITTLVNQIVTNRIPHAYLFCGSRGTGKTSTSKVLARAINCAHPDENGEPCGQCEACRQLENDNNLEVMEIDAASNNGVDEIRDLREKVKYPPSVGRYKVYIIDEVHMLSTGAFNALLKTLEEPPAHAVFILATTEPQKLPATILSRCQRFDFKRIPARLIEERLSLMCRDMGAAYEKEALELIARSAEGGMRDAQSLLDMCLSYGADVLKAQTVREVLGASNRSFLFEFCEALIGGDAAGALRMIDEMNREGRDAQVFAREVSGHIRNLIMAQLCKENLDELLEITKEDAARFMEQAARATSARLMRLMELFIRAESDMKWASSARVVLELCAVRGCHPEREVEVEALLDRIQSLELKLKGGFVAPAQEAEKPQEKPAPVERPNPKVQENVPPAASGSDAELYKQAVRAVRKADIANYSPLSKAKFAGVEGDVVHLVFPKEGAIYIKMLERENARASVEGQLSAAFGRPMRMKLSAEAAPQKAQSTGARENLSNIYDVFGRDKVEVIDD